jgi:hypothetical protein
MLLPMQMEYPLTEILVLLKMRLLQSLERTIILDAFTQNIKKIFQIGDIYARFFLN